jgi:N-acyl homoserine lactone hydrolase
MPERQSESGVALEVLQTAEVPTPYGYVFRAGENRITRMRSGLTKKRGMLKSPSLAFVVRHPNAGVLLIDTGLHADASSDLRKDFGLPMSILFRDIQPAETPFDEQLRSIAVEPEEVERVVMTHLHVDHTSGMRLLPNATFICTREEWVAAHRPFAAANGYVRHHLPPAARTRLVDYGSDGEAYGGFAKTIDLLGDGSVRLIFTPGHTRGHQSVLVALGDGTPVLLVGDAAYTLRSIQEQILPVITADDDASRRSLGELNAFAGRGPDVMLVPTHDPDAFKHLLPAGA